MKLEKPRYNETKIERRKHWRDRRVLVERRNSGRISQAEYDCRDGAPRRESDIAGKLVEGEIWWSGDRRFA